MLLHPSQKSLESITHLASWVLLVTASCVFNVEKMENKKTNLTAVSTALTFAFIRFIAKMSSYNVHVIYVYPLCRTVSINKTKDRSCCLYFSTSPQLSTFVFNILSAQKSPVTPLLRGGSRPSNPFTGLKI